MEHADFLGIFAARGEALKAVFPEDSASGLWQAWKGPGDEYRVQPLDMQRRPTGNVSVMRAGDFQYALAPLPSDEDIAAVGRRFLRANSPDLLEMWYEQDRADANRPEQGIAARPQMPPAPQGPATVPPVPAPTVSPSSPPASATPAAPKSGGILPENAVQGTLTKEPLNGSAISLEVSEQEDPSLRDLHDVLRQIRREESEGKEFPPPGGFQVEVQEASERSNVSSPAAQEKGVRRGELPSLFAAPHESGNDGAAVAPPAGSENSDFVVEIQDEEYYEERAATLEHSMRAEFASLLGQLDDSPYPALEQELERLLMRGAGFNWKQKLMFSEFGMALRRKGKPRLALMAHERALGLAPGDGHILFNLARSEYELGDMPAARVYLEQALRVLPDFTPARNFLAFLDEHQKAGGGTA